jgi:hypothetical protein
MYIGALETRLCVGLVGGRRGQVERETGKAPVQAAGALPEGAESTH